MEGEALLARAPKVLGAEEMSEEISEEISEAEMSGAEEISEEEMSGVEEILRSRCRGWRRCCNRFGPTVLSLPALDCSKLLLLLGADYWISSHGSSRLE